MMTYGHGRLVWRDPLQSAVAARDGRTSWSRRARRARKTQSDVALDPPTGPVELRERLVNDRRLPQANQETASTGGNATRSRTLADTRPWISKPTDLAGLLKRAIAARGLTTREVVRRVPRRHVATVYRLLAGQTPDPGASTIASVCTALDLDPDELLEVSDPMANLDAELRQALDDVQQLSQEDRWVVVNLLRVILARRPAGAPAS